MTVAPSRVGPGEHVLTFTVPNELFVEESVSRVDEVVVEAPRGVRIGQAEAKAGWAGTVRAGKAIWSKGSILHRQYETFGIEVEVPADARLLHFRVTERFAVPRGQLERFPVLVPVRQDSSSSNGAHGIAVAALIVAVAAAAVAATACFLMLARWLRGP